MHGCTAAPEGPWDQPQDNAPPRPPQPPKPSDLRPLPARRQHCCSGPFGVHKSMNDEVSKTGRKQVHTGMHTWLKRPCNGPHLVSVPRSGMSAAASLRVSSSASADEEDKGAPPPPPLSPESSESGPVGLESMASGDAPLHTCMTDPHALPLFSHLHPPLHRLHTQ